MGKDTDRLIARAVQLIGNSNLFEVQSKENEVSIFCKSCQTKFKVDAVHLSTQFQSHVRSEKHKKSSASNVLQPSISSAIAGACANNAKMDTFAVKITKAFLEAGIPIWKLRHPSIKKFFLDEYKEVLPSVHTLYGKLDLIYQNTLQKIKVYIGGHPIYFIVDETTDKCKRCVLNVLVGKIDGTFSEPVLLSTVFLEHTNNTTVQQAVNQACVTLYGVDIPYDKVWFLISDQAAYMLKSGRGLKQLFPNLKHVTCLIHGLNRVCEFIKDNYDDVNKLIASMKATLVKSNHRRQIFREICKLPLPPDVIEIRWNSWLNAAFYYAEHFSAIRIFATSLSSKKSKAVTKLKKVVAKRSINTSLYEVHKYKFLAEAITQLEKHGLTVPQQLEILKSVKSKLSGEYLEKLERVLDKNPDVNFFENQPADQKIKCEYVPMVSIYVEQSFSIYKYILSDRRHSLTESNIAKLNVVQFNNFIDDTNDD